MVRIQNLPDDVVNEGEYVLLLGGEKLRLITKAEKGKVVSTIRGNVRLDDVIGRELGTRVRTSLGDELVVTRPSIEEFMLEKYDRPTQVIYLKDAAYIIMKAEIGPGCVVVEAGSGSGFMTTFLALHVQPDGKVISYDVRRDFQETAKRNVKMLGLDKYVDFRLRDVAKEGFDLPDKSVDAVILDMAKPWEVLSEAYRVLKHGRYLVLYLPSILQVDRVLREYKSCGFVDPEVVEVLVRKWKPVSEELRPDTWMIAHTGFLVFLRKP